MSDLERALKMMVSSNRLMNSGGKWAATAPVTKDLISGETGPSSISVKKAAPRLEVKRIIVFLKSTRRPEGKKKKRSQSREDGEA